MSATRFLRYAYLAYIAKPQADRSIYQIIRRHQVGSIVELGIGKATRTCRMIDLASRYRDDKVRYTGIDLFEGRTNAASGLAYKDAHQVLKQTSAKVRLVPGDPLTALSRVANDLTETDLIVIAADQEADSLEKAWFYVPRMLTEKSVVCVEEPKADRESSYRVVTVAEIDERARQRTAPLSRAA